MTMRTTGSLLDVCSPNTLTIDMNDIPVELVAARMEHVRLVSSRPVRLIHKDLWFDGRWHEPR